jgi:aerobic carbon-monoxide dehydrogenase large subunit
VLGASASCSSAKLADDLPPGSAEMPPVRIIHMETPSPYARFGRKGLGEGGAIASPGGDHQCGE